MKTEPAIQQWIVIEQHPLSKLPGTWISKWTNIPALIELVQGTQPKYVHSLFEKYGTFHPNADWLRSHCVVSKWILVLINHLCFRTCGESRPK